MTLSARDLPAPTREGAAPRRETCALSGLPIEAGTAVTVVMAMRPRRTDPDDGNWAPGAASEEEMVGFPMRATYDGTGWFVASGADAADRVTLERLRAALRGREVHDGGMPADLTFDALGGMAQRAERDGAELPFGPMVVRADAMAEALWATGADTVGAHVRVEVRAALAKVGEPGAECPGVDARHSSVAHRLRVHEVFLTADLDEASRSLALALSRDPGTDGADRVAEAATFRHAVRTLGVALAPSVRGGREGVRWTCVQAFQDRMAELAPEAAPGMSR